MRGARWMPRWNGLVPHWTVARHWTARRWRVLLQDLHRREPDVLRARLRGLVLRDGQAEQWLARHGAPLTGRVLRALAPRDDAARGASLGVHWAESLRQFGAGALARPAGVGRAARPGGVSALQAWLAAYSLRQLALGERAPTDQRGWERLWQRALREWRPDHRPPRRPAASALLIQAVRGHRAVQAMQGSTPRPPTYSPQTPRALAGRLDWEAIHRIASRTLRLAHLLALPQRPAARRDWMVRRQATSWLADPALCADWLAVTRPTQRWALLGVLFPRGAWHVARDQRRAGADRGAAVSRPVGTGTGAQPLALSCPPCAGGAEADHGGIARAAPCAVPVSRAGPRRGGAGRWLRRVAQISARPERARSHADAGAPGETRAVGSAGALVAAWACRPPSLPAPPPASRAPSVPCMLHQPRPSNGKPASRWTGRFRHRQGSHPWPTAQPLRRRRASKPPCWPNFAALKPPSQRARTMCPMPGSCCWPTTASNCSGMLDLLDGPRLRDARAASKAVRCLAWLAHGHDDASEPECILPKLLCGMPLGEPLCAPAEGSTRLDAETRAVLDSLLGAVIAHWKTHWPDLRGWTARDVPAPRRPVGARGGRRRHALAAGGPARAVRHAAGPLAVVVRHHQAALDAGGAVCRLALRWTLPSMPRHCGANWTGLSPRSTPGSGSISRNRPGRLQQRTTARPMRRRTCRRRRRCPPAARCPSSWSSTGSRPASGWYWRWRWHRTCVPPALDLFFVKNRDFDRGFTEFGGSRAQHHGGFLPNGETAVFLLAGENLAARIAALALFDPDHAFAQAGLLQLDGEIGGEPQLSGALRVSAETLQRLQTGVWHKPDYNAQFPARRIATALAWDDLVLAPEVMDEIEIVRTWLRDGPALMETWGLAKTVKPGYRCLFYGPPGTGKTLTATLLGQDAGVDVYRIDLSMVVSKYIGETEKNLARVFDQAQSRRWVLFFDEADALFGKRSATQSSNDRHANQEVAYLLQRVEDFPGTVILATNLRGNLDEAFSRRFQSMIYFPMPDATQRLRLWRSLIREPERLAADIDLPALAERHELSWRGHGQRAALCRLAGASGGRGADWGRAFVARHRARIAQGRRTPRGQRGGSCGGAVRGRAQVAVARPGGNAGRGFGRGGGLGGGLGACPGPSPSFRAACHAGLLAGFGCRGRTGFRAGRCAAGGGDGGRLGAGCAVVRGGTRPARARSVHGRCRSAVVRKDGCDHAPGGSGEPAGTYRFRATGGEPPYVFRAADNGLPEGLTLDAAGNVNGATARRGGTPSWSNCATAGDKACASALR